MTKEEECFIAFRCNPKQAAEGCDLGEKGYNKFFYYPDIGLSVVPSSFVL